MKTKDIDGLRGKPKKGEELKDNHLKSILETLFPTYEWIYEKGIRNGSKNCLKDEQGNYYKPDAHCVEEKIVVEVDGDSIGEYGHFSNEKVAQKDIKRDKFYRDLGYKVIAIPPYVQLDSEMIYHYFNIKHSKPLYKASTMHGFMHSKISLPANFSPSGLKRFEKDMQELPLNVRLYIVNTLKKRIRQVKEEDPSLSVEEATNFVIPSKIKYILDFPELSQ